MCYVNLGGAFLRPPAASLSSCEPSIIARPISSHPCLACLKSVTLAVITRNPSPRRQQVAQAVQVCRLPLLFPTVHTQYLQEYPLILINSRCSYAATVIPQRPPFSPSEFIVAHRPVAAERGVSTFPLGFPFSSSL